MRIGVVVALLAVAGSLACGDGVGTGVALAPRLPCLPGQICVNGTVKFVNLEGGCWSVRGDNQITYEAQPIPDKLRSDGQRVYMVASLNRNALSVCMIGTMVNVHSMRALP